MELAHAAATFRTDRRLPRDQPSRRTSRPWCEPPVNDGRQHPAARWQASTSSPDGQVPEGGHGDQLPDRAGLPGPGTRLIAFPGNVPEDEVEPLEKPLAGTWEVIKAEGGRVDRTGSMVSADGFIAFRAVPAGEPG